MSSFVTKTGYEPIVHLFRVKECVVQAQGKVESLGSLWVMRPSSHLGQRRELRWEPSSLEERQRGQEHTKNLKSSEVARVNWMYVFSVPDVY